MDLVLDITLATATELDLTMVPGMVVTARRSKATSDLCKYEDLPVNQHLLESLSTTLATRATFGIRDVAMPSYSQVPRSSGTCVCAAVSPPARVE